MGIFSKLSNKPKAPQNSIDFSEEDAKYIHNWGLELKEREKRMTEIGSEGLNESNLDEMNNLYNEVIKQHEDLKAILNTYGEEGKIQSEYINHNENGIKEGYAGLLENYEFELKQKKDFEYLKKEILKLLKPEIKYSIEEISELFKNNQVFEECDNTDRQNLLKFVVNDLLEEKKLIKIRQGLLNFKIMNNSI